MCLRCGRCLFTYVNKMLQEKPQWRWSQDNTELSDKSRAPPSFLSVTAYSTVLFPSPSVWFWFVQIKTPNCKNIFWMNYYTQPQVYTLLKCTVSLWGRLSVNQPPILIENSCCFSSCLSLSPSHWTWSALYHYHSLTHFPATVGLILLIATKSKLSLS